MGQSGDIRTGRDGEKGAGTQIPLACVYLCLMALTVG